MNELGRKPPMFEEASFIAEQILDSGYEFDSGELMYNKFKYGFTSDIFILFYFPSIVY